MDQQPTMKNVHFSPVVSQLRYPPQHILPFCEAPLPSNTNTTPNLFNFLNCEDSDTPNYSNNGGGIQKVTVVQQIDRPKLQKIQVSVPPSPPPSSPPPQYLQENQGLFVNQLRVLNERRQRMAPPNKLNSGEEILAGNCEKISNFQSAIINGKSSDLRGPPPPLLEELVNVQRNRNLMTVGSLEELVEGNAERGIDCANNFASGPAAAAVNQNNKQLAEINISNESSSVNGNNFNCNGATKRRNSSKSFLQWITFGKLGKRNSKEIGNGSSSTATKAQKRSSCPPLGHPLLLNGGGEDNPINDFCSWRGGGDQINNQVFSLTVDKKGLSTPDKQTATVATSKTTTPTSSSSFTSFNPLSTSTTKRSDSLPPKPSIRNSSKRSPLLLPRLFHHPSHSTDDSEDDEFSVNFERIIESIFQPESEVNSEPNSNPISPSYHPPYLNNSQKTMATSKTNTSTIKPVLDESAADEEGLRTMDSMEQKIIGLSTTDNHPQSNDINHFHGNGHINIPSDSSNGGDLPSISKTHQKSATIPQVTGKPPIPPSHGLLSTNKYGISSSDATTSNKGNFLRRHHHQPPLHARNKNPSTSESLPEAMLELAQKLVSFREELHRSREHLAVSHSATLEEIHSLRNTLAETTPAIDPISRSSRRSLPPSSRHSSFPTTTSSNTTEGAATPTTRLPPTPPFTRGEYPSSSISAAGAASCAGGSTVPATTTPKSQLKNYNYLDNQNHPTSSLISSRLLEEWDKSVERAKEQFTRRGQVPIPPEHLELLQVREEEDYCDGSEWRDPSAFGGRRAAAKKKNNTSIESKSLCLLETDLDGGNERGATSGPRRENDLDGFSWSDLPSTELPKNGGVVSGQERLYLSTDDNHYARFTDKQLKTGNHDGGNKKSVKQSGSCAVSVVPSTSTLKCYPGSLQNLNCESVKSSRSSFGYSHEDLFGGGQNQMATLKPCEPPGGQDGGKEDRSRSMEFLQDSEKNAHLLPPENTLQKTQQAAGAPGGERRMSEHELRIQRSLQKLNVPDWYKNYAGTSQPSSAANTPSKTRAGDFGGSGTGLAGGWPGLSSSKTNSLTSLQSAGRYTGSKSGFGQYTSSGQASGRHSRAATATGGRSSRESLMSPSSTASASPSPNFERSSFTYGMPYALTRFAAARMSCGASPASLSPSPSPVGGIALSSTSTPVSSGPASARYHGYQKTPYLGWRSQERLSSKSMYRTPSERLAADLIAQQKQKQSPLQTPQTPQQLTPSSSSLAASPAGGGHHHHPLHQSSSSTSTTTPTTVIQVEPQRGGYTSQGGMPPPEIEVNRVSPTKSNVTSATASDLSLNNSEESNSHKLNRVRSSIKEVSNAIVDYVNESKPLDDGMNGRASPRRGLVWLESSFVGTKPIDSPSTPDTPSTFIGRAAASRDSTLGGGGGGAGHTSHFRFDTHELPTASSGGGGDKNPRSRGGGGGDGGDGESTSSTSHYTTYISRNEQMEERSNSSSVSSPTLEDILDSLLALRRPNKKFRSKQGGKGHESATSPLPVTTSSTIATPTATSSTTKPSSDYTTSRGGGGSDPLSDDIITSSRYYHSSISSSTPPPSTAGATYGSSSYGDDITSSYRSQTTRVTSSPSKTGGGATSTTTYQYQYQPTTSSSPPATSSWLDQQQSTTTSEIGTASEYLRSKASIASKQDPTSSSTTSSSHRSYQSDWQDRMNQPPPDSTFSYGSTSGGGGTSDTFTSISSRYSTSSIGGGDVSSPGGMSSPAVSSLHSTPTHQPYNRQTSSGGGNTSKDYYSSSCHSSPAKSILGGGDRTSGGDIMDSNELLYRRSTSISGGGGSTYPPPPRDPLEEDELAFGNPTEIMRSSVAAAAANNTSSSQAQATGGTTVAPLQGGVIINPLTGLSEYSNPPTPARHRRVSFDLDFSDKEEKSSSRSRNKEENVGGTIQCRNPKCAKTATGLEARREFKVCHNCNAYYCSRECRRAHWEKHKKTCMQSRVGAICKQIISHVKEDSYVMNQLSTSAKRGFLAKGRGVVKLFFNSPDRAERFLTGGLPELPEPLYIPHADMLPEEMGAQTFSELSDQCRSYNTDTRFVLYACVCVVNEVPTYGAVKWERELISRSSKLRLLLPRQFFEESQRHHHYPTNPAHHFISPSGLQMATSPGGGGGEGELSSNGGTDPSSHHPHVPLYDSVPVASSGGGGAQEEFPAPPPPLPPPHQGDSNDTLILRSVPPPASHQLSASEHKRLREVSFTNIQKHLLLRGVDIKRCYPDIFSKLCRYVEQDEPFLPVTIYPRNKETGRQFVCVIMPECSDSSCGGHTSQQNQEATIAAAVASAAAFTSSFAALGGVGGAYQKEGQRQGLQRVETINISEPGDDDQDYQYDLT